MVFFQDSERIPGKYQQSRREHLISWLGALVIAGFRPDRTELLRQAEWGETLYEGRTPELFAKAAEILNAKGLPTEREVVNAALVYIHQLLATAEDWDRASYDTPLAQLSGLEKVSDPGVIERNEARMRGFLEAWFFLVQAVRESSWYQERTEPGSAVIDAGSQLFGVSIIRGGVDDSAEGLLFKLVIETYFPPYVQYRGNILDARQSQIQEGGSAGVGSYSELVSNFKSLAEPVVELLAEYGSRVEFTTADHLVMKDLQFDMSQVPFFQIEDPVLEDLASIPSDSELRVALGDWRARGGMQGLAGEHFADAATAVAISDRVVNGRLKWLSVKLNDAATALAVGNTINLEVGEVYGGPELRVGQSLGVKISDQEAWLSIVKDTNLIVLGSLADPADLRFVSEDLKQYLAALLALAQTLKNSGH